MDNNVQIETNGSKYLPATKADDPPLLGQLGSVSIYSTRKSSRRLNQIQLNADYILDGATLNTLAGLKDLKDSHTVHPSSADSAKKEPASVNGSSSAVNSSTAHNQSNQNAGNPVAVVATKQQRKWEQWQVDDTKWFFEALNEHGKDFNAIHNYMVGRSKKKGVAEELIKNKEQIRCYYNRQWNKICSIFDCNDEQQAVGVLDKATRQLYALINYGEMWKKNNFKNDLKLDAKFKAHLNELVFKGYTFLKIGKKGKNIKLKTPVCKALKKIYYFESIYKSVNQNLPKDIVIELVPANNYAWMTVHCLSQNPRVRIRCSLQRRFASLIKYLDDRWNDQKYNNLQIEALSNECNLKSPKNHDRVGEDAAEPSAVRSANSTGGQCSGDSSSRKVFKVKPHPTHHRNLTGLKFTRIQPVPFNSQMDISLSAYLLKANSKQPGELKRKGKSHPNANCSKGARSANNRDDSSVAGPQSVNNHVERSNTAHVLETVRGLNLLNDIVASNYKENQQQPADEPVDLNPTNGNRNEPFGHLSPEEQSLHLPDPPPNATIAEWLSANINGMCGSKGRMGEEANSRETSRQCSSKEASAIPANGGADSPKAVDQKADVASSKRTAAAAETQDHQESIYNRMKKIVDPQQIKNGWSADDTEDLTIGELYLMLKKPAKIVLQYDWSLAVSADPASDSSELTKETKDLPKATSQCHTTNCSSLVAKLITAFTIELMSLNKERVGSSTIELESDERSAKSRKTKKLKTNHSAEANNPADTVNGSEPNADQISAGSSSNDPAGSTTAANAAPTNGSSTTNGSNASRSTKSQQSTTKEAAASSTGEKFAVPCSPVPKPANHKASNKGRIVNEQLLQEAKEQLNDIKFINTTRRNIRKPLMKPPQQQQIQLNLNTNQLLGNNLCQLFANQAGTALTTVPMNMASAPNGQTAALISVITQVNQSNSVLPNHSLQTINIDGTNATAIQINNATTLNDLCTLVTGNAATCTAIASNETELGNAVNGANGSVSQSNPQTVSNTAQQRSQTADFAENRPTGDRNEANQNGHHQKFATLSAVNPSGLPSSFAMDSSLPNLSMNSMLGEVNKSTTNKPSSPFNESCLKAISDDKSVGFSNLLDISLSDTIFNDSLAFPSDVSIESSFTKEHDQTLNTPIKLQPLQKSAISAGHPGSTFPSQFSLFDSNLGSDGHLVSGLGSNLGGNLNGNRTESTSFSDGWINNLGSDLSLGNIFDCTNEQANFKSFESTPFKDKKDELFN